MAVSQYWQDYLAKRQPVAPRVASAMKVYDKLKSWINRYRGGMPAGFAAAIAYWESGGKMSSVGDPSLSEVGIYQVTSSFPPKVGVDPAARYDAETNVFLGLLQYQWLVANLKYRYPNLIELGSDDSWKLARLAFQIGFGGTTYLIDRAGASYGDVYAALVRYVDATGGVKLGTQEAGKVWYRVHIVETIWQLGQAVKPGRSYWPILIPAKVAYAIDNKLIPYFKEYRVSPFWIGVGVLGLAGISWYVWRSYRGEPFIPSSIRRMLPTTNA